MRETLKILFYSSGRGLQEIRMTYFQIFHKAIRNKYITRDRLHFLILRSLALIAWIEYLLLRRKESASMKPRIAMRNWNSSTVESHALTIKSLLSRLKLMVTVGASLTRQKVRMIRWGDKDGLLKEEGIVFLQQCRYHSTPLTLAILITKDE